MDTDESSPETRERKRAARIHNERVKLSANALNALAIAVTIAALIVPGVASPRSLLDLQGVIWFFFALGLHLLARATLGLLRHED